VFETTTPAVDRRLPRRLMRLTGTVAVIAATAALLGACGSDDDPTGGAGGGGGSGDAAETPSYYPADYADVIEGSKKEGGTLSIYSNTDQENWAPIFEAFQQQYPWVEKIGANNLDSDEVFQRYLSEVASSGSDADMLVTNAAQEWATFERDDADKLEPYESPELDKLPEFAQLLPGVYAMSTDVMTIAYNTALIEDEVTGFSSLAEIVSADPDKFKDKLTSRDVEGSFGFTVSNAFTTARPEAWSSLEQLLPLARPEDSSGTQIDKILAGEYAAGFLISSGPGYPAQDKSGGLFKLVYPDDGTVVLPRAIAISSTAPHPNTAKLFLDFVLSQAGQTAVAKGGLTSYREDAEAEDPSRTYAGLEEAVGKDNVIFVDYKEVPQDDVNAFISKWNGLLGR
jgi:iron(III) transport system substrate-binding protein